MENYDETSRFISKSPNKWRHNLLNSSKKRLSGQLRQTLYFGCCLVWLMILFMYHTPFRIGQRWVSWKILELSDPNANVFSYIAILPFGTLIKFVVWFPICPPFWLRVRTTFLPETTSHYSSWWKPAWIDFWDVGNNLCCLLEAGWVRKGLTRFPSTCFSSLVIS